MTTGSASRCTIAGSEPFRFGVRVRPGARRDQVGGRWAGPRGAALIVAVAAPAVEGKANEAVRRALAKAFGVRRSEVRIVAGERGRDKIVELTAPPEDARDRLAVLLAGMARKDMGTKDI
jgi:uncharacterized protein (TIGR00251 family)